MPALTPDTIRAATDTLARLFAYLREDPDPRQARALVEPLLDQHPHLPVMLGDALHALAGTAPTDPLTTRTAEQEQAAQRAHNYVAYRLAEMYDSINARRDRACCRCR
ncbi:hypothetical protein PV387_40695 [Streptomyces sp. ME02-6987-2C]|uniref:hypothetical protein n=1 Tax=unclassified Streptomyces TaxID=2593676 RepID=UPI0029A64683|nr:MULTISPECIES: hypothetical protein [unclassified Streptomyces]MDX3372229.1 hypothetical protein [Streptomyces sp. ME02-6987-2C]MDX3426337.1 hypothetical protein [Streptomyces sp. ME02-6985-2c]